MECAHCNKSLLVRGYDLEDAATRILVHGWRAFADNVLHCARCDGREKQQVCEHWTPQRKPGPPAASCRSAGETARSDPPARGPNAAC
jgi:hypothetical protein